MIDVGQDGNLYLYVSILSNDKRSLKAYSYNCSLDPPAQVAATTLTFGADISSPAFVPLGTTVLVTYNINGGS